MLSALDHASKSSRNELTADLSVWDSSNKQTIIPELFTSNNANTTLFGLPTLLSFYCIIELVAPNSITYIVLEFSSLMFRVNLNVLLLDCLFACIVSS